MTDRAYRTTKYKLTLASTIIDRLLFIFGLVAIFICYYGAIDVANTINKSMSESLVVGNSDAYPMINDFIEEINSFLGEATQVITQGIVIALLIIVTIALILHFIYMLPMLIVSRVSLANARTADFPASADSERFKCDAILKIVMHSLKLLFILFLAIILETPYLFIIAIPYVAVIVISIITLAIKSNALKFDPVEVDPIPETPHSEYYDFDSELE